VADDLVQLSVQIDPAIGSDLADAIVGKILEQRLLQCKAMPPGEVAASSQPEQN
jgi:hypothetical protein